MMVEEELDFEGFDRTLFNLSSWMTDVFAGTYGALSARLVAPLDPKKFDNATSTIREIGMRALIALGGVLSFCFAGTYLLLGAVVLGAGSKIFRRAAFSFQKRGFTHVRGDLEEEPLKNGQAKIMTWNIRGHGGGLHYKEGGVVHWKSRIDQIVESIRYESPDVIVLQEVYDGALIEALISRLKGDYAHFYTHLGAGSSKNENGTMVITKCAVSHFTHQNFTLSDQEVQRGFEVLEIKAHPEDLKPCARIIGSQLSPSKEAQEMRMEQVKEMVASLALKTLNLPTFFVGSLNVDRDSKEEGSYLKQYLYHSYLEKEPTYSEALKNQWAPVFEGVEASTDFISFFKRNPFPGCALPVIEKGVRLIDTHLVRGFDPDYSTKTARSDHHAVVTTISGLC